MRLAPRVLGVLVLAASGCQADCHADKVTVGGTTVHDSAYRTFHIDQAYAKKHGVEVPVELRLRVPKERARVYFPPAVGAGNLIFFKVFTPDDRQVVQTLGLTPVTLPVKPRAERLEHAKTFLARTAFPHYVAGKPRARMIDTFTTSTGPYDAVGLLGEYVDPSAGPVLVTLVAVLNPQSRRCVAATSLNVVKRSPLGADDLRSKGLVWSALRTLRFGAIVVP